MQIIFTICSNNYLHQALTLAESVRLHSPQYRFVLGLADEVDSRIDYQSLGLEIIPAFKIEAELIDLVEKFNIIELNTAVKPRFFEYMFKYLRADEIIYLDPDTCLFDDIGKLLDLYPDNEILLTPHILTPIPLDKKRPDEQLFLNYGLFNLGFLALRKGNAADLLVTWWKQRTYTLGYDKPAAGLFTDQLWMNFAPILFNNVGIIKEPGANMAPWNLHERVLTEVDGKYTVNSTYPLYFYHFSGFDVEKNLVHRDYNRFNFSNRKDLVDLYSFYRDQMIHFNREQYKSIDWSYQRVKTAYQAKMELQAKAEEKIKKRSMSLTGKVKYTVRALLTRKTSHATQL